MVHSPLYGSTIRGNTPLEIRAPGWTEVEIRSWLPEGRFGVLEEIFVVPRFHHWHHGIEREAIDVNFAIHFPFFDKIFGTHHMPEDRWPEGYGIGGAAIIVDCMTDNKVRTVAEVRHAFSKHGGNMGTEGSVAFQFKHCGQLIFAPGASEDKIMEVALDSGADDVITDEDGAIEVLTPYTGFEAVKNALEAAGLKPEVAEVTMRADNMIELSEADSAKMQRLLDVLEDLDDTQDVFHNAELS